MLSYYIFVSIIHILEKNYQVFLFLPLILFLVSLAFITHTQWSIFSIHFDAYIEKNKDIFMPLILLFIFA